MKKYIKILLTVISAGLLTFGAQSITYAQYDNGYDNYDNYDDQGGQQIGFDDFYEQLSPYGRWVNEPSYGRVWVANVANFQPYSSNGYWTYTNYGWTWVSNYDWGWAPFHYGRWGHSNRIGWFWVPGYEWGPAWVTWSSASNMYGWAPLGPGMSFGVNISIGSFPANYWTFMPRRYMGYHNINNYYVNRSRYTTIIRNTKIINNYGRGSGHRYAMGPQRREVERSTGRAVRQVRVVNSRSRSNTGVRNNELHVYRPSVRGSSNSKATQARRSTPSRSTTPRASSRSNVQRKAPTRSQATPSTRQQTERANRSKATQQRQQNARQSQANKRTQARAQAAQKRAAQQQQTRQRKQQARQQKAQQAQQSRQKAQQARQQRAQRKQQARPAPQSKARVQRSAPARTQQRSAPARSNTRSSSGRASRGR